MLEESQPEVVLMAFAVFAAVLIIVLMWPSLHWGVRRQAARWSGKGQNEECLQLNAGRPGESDTQGNSHEGSSIVCARDAQARAGIDRDRPDRLNPIASDPRALQESTRPAIFPVPKFGDYDR